LVDYMFRENREDCLFFEFTGSENQDAVEQMKKGLKLICLWSIKLHLMGLRLIGIITP